jgi:hypothetical protein
VSSEPGAGQEEQPFLPELAWAYFAAYTTILYGSFLRFKVLTTGLNESDKFLTSDATKKILKATLPHQSKFIDEHEPEAYHYLLEELESLLLIELRKIVEGKEADQAAAVRAKQITDALKSADKERAEKAVAGAALA